MSNLVGGNSEEKHLLGFRQLPRDLLGVAESKQCGIIRRDAFLRPDTSLRSRGRLTLCLRETRFSILYFQQNINKLGVSHWDSLAFPNNPLKLLLGLALVRSLYLGREFSEKAVVILDDCVFLSVGKLGDDTVDVISLGVPHFMSAVTNFRSDFICKKNGEGLIATCRGCTCKRVQKAAGDAKLDQGVVELVAISKEATVDDDSVDDGFDQILRGEPAMNVELLTM